MAKIYTSNINYANSDKLDVTIKGNHPIGRVFAPTWKMVKDFKSGVLSEEEYKIKYYNLLHESYLNHRDIWDKISKWNSVVFVCYCKSTEFCHRYLLAYYFSYLYKNSEYLGEIKNS